MSEKNFKQIKILKYKSRSVLSPNYLRTKFFMIF